MGLTKKIIDSNPDIKITKELEERCDKIYEALAEGKTVNIINPSDVSTKNITEILKKDPPYFLRPGKGYDSGDGLSYEEFVKQIIEGE